MIYILSAILAAGILTVVCWPLFSKTRSLDSAILDETEWDLIQRKKDVIFANIQDLDFEHQCGKLSEEDYKDLRVEMVSEAATVMNQINNIEVSHDLDALIRREVTSRQSSSLNDIVCPNCRKTTPKANQFCPECGEDLRG